jgi:iron transport multicopper oxidase
MDAGLAATMIEAPFDIQKKLSIPENHYQVCNASGTQISGNAAGNKENFLDLTGEPEQVADLPKGFTARGIVALVFSCLAAIVGLVSIFW